MSVGDDLRDIEVLDLAGRPMRMGHLWMDHTIVLSFVRHFGCMLCREQVTALHDSLPSIRRNGAELVVVGSGQPEQISDFREQLGLNIPIYVDPERRAYDAAGLKRGLWLTFKPRTWGNWLRAYRQGMRQGSLQGDNWQQGGVFVIRPGNVTSYAYVSQEAGDHPPVEEVIAAV